MLSAGALDPSLGGTGVIPSDFGGAVAVQSDGKILLAGTGYVDGATGFAIARYHPDGTLDTSFSGDGKAGVDFGVPPDAYYDLEQLTGIAVQSDGKIVLVGSAYRDFALARFNADGSLDTSFGVGGKVLTNFSQNTVVTTGGIWTYPSWDRGEAVAIQVVDGVEKILLIGSTDSAFALARYNPDGTLDATFELDGKVSTRFTTSSSDHAYDVVIQPDNKIVAVGSSYQSANDLSDDFAVVRYDVNGLLDPTFGVGGKVTTNFGVYRTGNSLSSLDYASGTYETATAVALQEDGKIVVGGGSYGVPASETYGNFALARYNGDGTLDLSFGDPVAADVPVRTGMTTTDFNLEHEWAYDLVLQSDQKIVLVGAAAYSDYTPQFARYAADGALDASFGIGGKVKSYGSLRGGSAAALEVVNGAEKVLVATGGGMGRFHTTGGPPVRLSVFANSASIMEGNSGSQTVIFTVSLSAPHDQPVTVRYDTPLDATERDFSVVAGALTFQPGETMKTVSVTVNGDTIYEWDEYLVLRLGDATDALIERPQAYIEITNDDNAPVTVSDVSLKEGHSGVTAFTFTITVSQASERYVNAVARTVDGTATAGSDYVEQLVVLNLTQPQTTSVTVYVHGDTVEEANETFTLRLTDNYNQGAVITEAAGVILNDDGPPPRIKVNDVKKKEGNKGVVGIAFTVSLSHASSVPVTVNYATADGSAKAGEDYQAASGTLTFAAGETSKTITIWVSGDKLKESDETFFLNLSGLSYGVLEDDQGMATILNDDR